MRLFPTKHKKLEVLEYNIAKPQSTQGGNKIVFAICVKNESAAIAEWLEFHAAAGVDRFVIYNDNCTDDTVEIARKTLPADMLEIIPWRQRLQDAKGARALQNQALAYAHAIANFRDDCRWMGFFDIDEFLFPTAGNSLRGVLEKRDAVDNIVLPWHMFGREGHRTTPEKIIPSYTRRYRDPYEIRVKGILNFKSIINPAKATKAHIHAFQTSAENTIWNSSGQAFKFGDHWKQTFHRSHDLQLNHYYIKSDAQLDEKINKGSPAHSEFTAAFRTTDQRADTLKRRANELDRDTIEDHAILDFCERIGFDPLG